MKFLSSLKKNADAYGMVVPVLVLYFLFVLYPLARGLYISFHQWDGLGDMKWIGLNNYRFILKDDVFWLSIRNTFTFAFVVTVVKNIFGLGLALILNTNIKYKTFFRVVSFAPVTLSFVVIGILWSWIFNPTFGLLNTVLKAAGLDWMILGWLSDPKVALWSVMWVDIWKWSGFHMVLFLAGLQGVPAMLYEAAAIDGANRFQQFLHVTLPSLKNVTYVSVLMSITGAFVSNYDVVYVMTGGGPFHATEVALTWITSTAFRFASVGKANAMSMILVLLVAVFGVMQLITMLKEK
jgi:raffinose/stachyose/melibiose transport system permease protein